MRSDASSPGLDPDVPEPAADYATRIEEQKMRLREALKRRRPSERKQVTHTLVTTKLTAVVENDENDENNSIIKAEVPRLKIPVHEPFKVKTPKATVVRTVMGNKATNILINCDDNYESAALMWRANGVKYTPRVVLRRPSSKAKGGCEIKMASLKHGYKGVRLVWQPWREVIGAKVRSELRWEFTMLIKGKAYSNVTFRASEKGDMVKWNDGVPTF